MIRRAARAPSWAVFSMAVFTVFAYAKLLRMIWSERLWRVPRRRLRVAIDSAPRRV